MSDKNLHPVMQAALAPFMPQAPLPVMTPDDMEDDFGICEDCGEPLEDALVEAFEDFGVMLCPLCADSRWEHESARSWESRGDQMREDRRQP